MSRYAVAIISPKSKIVHKVYEGEGQDAVLRKFFEENMSDSYSIDDEGYYYFKEDYFDAKAPVGSMIEV